VVVPAELLGQRALGSSLTLSVSVTEGAATVSVTVLLVLPSSNVIDESGSLSGSLAAAPKSAGVTVSVIESQNSPASLSLAVRVGAVFVHDGGHAPVVAWSAGLKESALVPPWSTVLYFTELAFTS